MANWFRGERGNRMQMQPSMVLVLRFAVLLVLASCQRNYGVLRDEVISRPHDPELKSTLVFFIHGDGSYSYHDAQGKRFEADAVILKEAMAVAASCSHAEVFIFHQKPKRKWLFLIDQPDGSFYYFRKGVQLASGSYHRRTLLSELDSEGEIIKTYHARESKERVSGFFYFGHALTELGDKNPNQSLNVHGLAQGMSCLLSEVDPHVMKFDLVVLSACYSGTPGIIAELAHYSRYILASPDDLHLAYLDIQPLRRFDNIGFSEVHSLARELASQSLARLQEWTQTSITLAIYDVESIAPFLEKVQNRQPVGLALQSPNSHQPVPVAYCDCLDRPPMAAEIPSAGVEVYYQPARFGRLKNKTHHSGWACWEAASK